MYDIIVTDTVAADGKTDVTAAIQKLIDSNPNRTIYFPDGVYRISSPILTPADPSKSVDLRLANYAVIRASENWDSPEAMIRLGGEHPANNIRTCGSNYSLTGGIIDGNGKANGISIDSGRETRICDVSIKHTPVGIHIKYGANNASSDADIMNVNIIGTGSPDSIGVLLEGYDNTLTNMRIADVHTGICLRSCGNILRNIHPLYTCDYTDYQNSCGFRDEKGGNFYNVCYSDHFGSGYFNGKEASSVYDSCFCMWYCAKGEVHTAFRSEGAFRSIVTNLKIGFFDDTTDNVVLDVKESVGTGVLTRLSVDQKLLTDHVYENYLQGGVIW